MKSLLLFQIPIFEIRSDGRDNFLSSLIFVGHYTIPEVSLLFYQSTQIKDKFVISVCYTLIFEPVVLKSYTFIKK